MKLAFSAILLAACVLPSVASAANTLELLNLWDHQVQVFLRPSGTTEWSQYDLGREGRLRISLRQHERHDIAIRVFYPGGKVVDYADTQIDLKTLPRFANFPYAETLAFTRKKSWTVTGSHWVESPEPDTPKICNISLVLYNGGAFLAVPPPCSMATAIDPREPIGPKAPTPAQHAKTD